MNSSYGRTWATLTIESVMACTARMLV